MLVSLCLSLIPRPSLDLQAINVAPIKSWEIKRGPGDEAIFASLFLPLSPSRFLSPLSLPTGLGIVWSSNRHPCLGQELQPEWGARSGAVRLLRQDWHSHWEPHGVQKVLRCWANLQVSREIVTLLFGLIIKLIANLKQWFQDETSISSKAYHFCSAIATISFAI